MLLILFALGGIMTKAHYIVLSLGLSLFFLDSSYGIGWIFGWIFVGLLRHFREPILEYIIDFENFSTRTYVAYLLGVMVWIAIPLVISLLFEDYINPIAVFAAFFADRALMFLINYFRKEK